MDYGTDWAERVGPDEEAAYEKLGERLVAIQEARDAKYEERGRALHRKGHGGARGRFTVREDLGEVLPAELHVGPFQPGASYDAAIRFSNGSFKRAPDKEPDVRGVAIKLSGVDGTKCLSGTEEPRNQDFLMIPGANTPMDDPEQFVTLLETASTGSQLTLVPRLFWALGPGAALKILRGLGAEMGKPFPGFPAGTFHSGTPFRFGPAAARFRLTPVGDPDHHDLHDLREPLIQAIGEGIAWDFAVQLYVDEATTPIEANSVPWPVDKAPFHTVARLEIPPADTDSEAFRALQEEVEAMTFDPWQAVEALRPLGAMNRARKYAYYASMKQRGVFD